MPFIMHIASDLHLEFHRDGGKSFLDDLRERCPEANGIIVAGDLSTADLLAASFDQLCALWDEVVFVNGNHDLYGSSLTDVLDIREHATQRHPNLHWLNNSLVTIGGQRIVGSTLWFPQSRHTDQYARQLSDFSQIEGFKPYEWNQKASDFLRKEVQKGDIVVTHQAPSAQSIALKYLGSPINCFFFSNEEETIQKKRPKTWVHGHHHSSANYKFEGTQVICNPFGYARREENPDFRWDMTLIW